MLSKVWLNLCVTLIHYQVNELSVVMGVVSTD